MKLGKPVKIEEWGRTTEMDVPDWIRKATSELLGCISQPSKAQAYASIAIAEQLKRIADAMEKAVEK